MGLYTENAHVAFYWATKAVAEKVAINGESTGGFKVSSMCSEKQ